MTHATRVSELSSTISGLRSELTTLRSNSQVTETRLGEAAQTCAREKTDVTASLRKSERRERFAMQTAGKCGGEIEISEEPQELLHRANLDYDDYEETCIWLVRSKNGGNFHVTLIDSPHVRLDEGQSRLILQNDFAVARSSVSTINTFGTEYSHNGPFIILYFYTKPSHTSQGFHLKLKEAGSSSHSLALRLTQYSYTGSRQLTMPMENTSEYEPNTRGFVWLKCPVGSRINLEAKFLDSENTHDGLQVFVFNIEEKKVVTLTTFQLSGRLNWVTGKSHKIQRNEHALVYFHSDDSVNGKGYQIDYTIAPA